MRLIEVSSLGKPVYMIPASVGGYVASYGEGKTFAVTTVERCGYDLGAGYHPNRCGETIPCELHKDARCKRCNKSTTEVCICSAHQFICGNPCCPGRECPCC